MTIEETVRPDGWSDVKIPNFVGLNKLLDADNLRNEQLSRALNVRIVNDKVVSAMGYDSIRAQSLTGIPMALHKFKSTTGIEVLLLFTTETVYRDDGTDWVEIPGSLLSGSFFNLFSVVSIPWADQVVFTNGVNKIQVWDFNSNTISIIGGQASLWLCKALAIFDNSLFLLNLVEGGANFPQRERHCDQGDITEWELGTAGRTDLMENTTPIICGAQLGAYLIIYRERGIHRVAVSENPLKRFQIDQMIPDNGVLTLGSVALFEKNSHIFWGRDNFYRYEGGYDIEPIGDDIKDIVFGPDSIEYADSKRYHHLLYIEEINELLALYSVEGDEELTHALIYRTRENAWSQAKYNHPVRCGAKPPDRVFPTWEEIEGQWDEQTQAWYELYINLTPRLFIFVTTENTFEFGASYTTNYDEEEHRQIVIETKDFSEYPYQGRLDWVDIRCKNGPYEVYYSVDEGENWTLYGEIPLQDRVRVVRLHRQVQYESIRFRINTYEGEVVSGVALHVGSGAQTSLASGTTRQVIATATVPAGEDQVLFGHVDLSNASAPTILSTATYEIRDDGNVIDSGSLMDLMDVPVTFIETSSFSRLFSIPLGTRAVEADIEFQIDIEFTTSLTRRLQVFFDVFERANQDDATNMLDYTEEYDETTPPTSDLNITVEAGDVIYTFASLAISGSATVEVQDPPGFSSSQTLVSSFLGIGHAFAVDHELLGPITIDWPDAEGGGRYAAWRARSTAAPPPDQILDIRSMSFRVSHETERGGEVQ